MMLAGFISLLLLTGGITSSYSEQPEHLDDQHKFNQSSVENGSTFNNSAELYEGGTTSDYTEPPTEPNEDSGDSKKNCSYQAVLNHLNLKNKELYFMARPVKHHEEITYVYLQMVIYGILDVREIEQTFIPYIWIYMSWINEHIRWHPLDFCGLESIVVPTEVLWKPDLIIEEMTEKDKAPPSPYLTISRDGRIELRNDLMLVSTCKMQVYKFPFDIQSCDLSFKSAVYRDTEMEFQFADSKIAETHKVTQYEWLFINMTVEKKTVNNLFYNQSMIVYTIKMRRRSVLYIANFLVPIMFFFCLDLASFLISESSGEKLSFKVTVLLAVTVMQLILNEILPSSSDRIPLIAVYCIGMFGLMMLSLLETILVMYLMEKDSESQDNEAAKDQSLSEDFNDGEMKKWTPCACVCDVSADEPPSELLSVAKEGTSSQLTEESNVLEKVSDELREVEKTLILLLSSRKPGYWTRVAKTINKVFFISYVTVAVLFLTVIFSIWIHADDK
ncbi:5-hydroxytryptamine receptor 3A-like isoform X1 [Sebastes umbrosus]|uniref:5-hydroxytryptamine receptor 3A-like isoform X1 n=2 Tax=Sebastes umbrosus TaxID=72105 RepID=UPI00189D0828|nr:5-hydroxytryptamine receptor 3A-like isoform X1 [Sebastes umbrosus]